MRNDASDECAYFVLRALRGGDRRRVGDRILLVSDEVVRRALGITAVLAFVVQMTAFAIARAWVKKQNVMAGWGSASRCGSRRSRSSD